MGGKGGEREGGREGEGRERANLFGFGSLGFLVRSTTSHRSDQTEFGFLSSESRRNELEQKHGRERGDRENELNFGTWFQQVALFFKSRARVEESYARSLGEMGRDLMDGYSKGDGKAG